MAYELGSAQDQQDEETQERLRNPLAPTLTRQAGGSGSQPLSVSGGGSTGGKFVNFERYLNANLDASNRTAGKVASNVAQRAAGAQGALNTATNAQTSRIADNSLSYGGEAMRSTGGNGQATTLTAGNNGYVQSANSNPALDGLATSATGQVEQTQPTTYVSPEDAYARSTASMNVGGIAGTQEYANAVGQVGKAGTLLNATKDTAGVQGLLRQQVKDDGRGNAYTSGMNRFDGALVNSVGKGRFAGLRNQYANLEQMLGDAVTADDAARQGAAASTTDAAGKYKALYDQWLKDEEERKKRDEAAANPDTSQYYDFRSP